MSKKIVIIVLASLCCFVAQSSQPDIKRGVSSIERREIEAQVAFLSTDSLRGRATGSQEAAIAAQYIASTMYGCGFDIERQSFWVDSVKRKSGNRAVGQLTNILCTIVGSDPSKTVVIGAHYDHIGVSQQGEIFNGADDNASGVSAVLQIARAFKVADIRPKYNVIFAFWDGEEIGSLGSKHFVNTSIHDSLIVARYMNFDMIGRNTDESRPDMFRYIYTESAPEFERWLSDAIVDYSLKLDVSYKAWDKPTSGSDNAIFALQGIPIVWFHTDGHADYHRISDTADKINYEKLTDIIRAAFVVAVEMSM